MTVFSNLRAALREGFVWLEFEPREGLHVVVKTITKMDVRRMRALAFARPTADDSAAIAEIMAPVH